MKIYNSCKTRYRRLVNGISTAGRQHYTDKCKASSAAKSAVNQLMTLRNWVIGYYIVEYEQDGSDRAEYGSHLLKKFGKIKLIKKE